MANTDRSNRSPRKSSHAVPLLSGQLQRVADQTPEPMTSAEAESELRRRYEAMHEEPERWDGMS
jgi:hypothetical protein